MTKALFVSDLHGRIEWYEKLFSTIRSECPNIVLLGGDLFPHALMPSKEYPHFLNDYLRPAFLKLQKDMGYNYPEVLLILGNDDPKTFVNEVIISGSDNLWTYLHNRILKLQDFTFVGYSYVPPSPFQLKDWEKYDVSRFIDPGCVSPEEGFHSTAVDKDVLRYSTIQKDLDQLFNDLDTSQLICLFHSPPYQTRLDRAALDDQMVDYAPLDVHVGSIAIKRFIEERQPTVTLHGHIHESSRITGHWQDIIGDTRSFIAAYEGPELAIIKFDLEHPDQATRLLI